MILRWHLSLFEADPNWVAVDFPYAPKERIEEAPFELFLEADANRPPEPELVGFSQAFLEVFAFPYEALNQRYDASMAWSSKCGEDDPPRLDRYVGDCSAAPVDAVGESINDPSLVRLGDLDNPHPWRIELAG